jgi:endonuclease I
MLLAWNTQDPVNAEIARNNAIYAQNNRNPYIDHPNMFNKSGTRQLIRKHLQYQPI